MTRCIVLCAALLFCVAFAPPERAYAGVSFGVFYSSLEQFGEWITISGDVYAWRPLDVGPEWRPYADGHWVWTDYGWYWTSEEPWAWAVYHYGRWYLDDYYGWVWIPGYDWAPAWVEWRYGGECVGWAPLGPYAVFSASFGIFYRTAWVTPYHYWCFTDWRYLTDPGLHNYIYRNETATRFIGRTRPGGSVQYDGGRIISRGPDRQFVERRGNVRIERAVIVDANSRHPDRLVRSGEHAALEVYRPTMEHPGSGEIDRPSRVRGADHPMRLDLQSLDIHARRQDREAGREYRPTESSRVPVPGGSDAAIGRGRVRSRSANPESWPDRRRNSGTVDQPRRRSYFQQYGGSSVPARPGVREYSPPVPRRETIERPRDFRQERPAAPRREVVPHPSRNSDTPRDNGRRR